MSRLAWLAALLAVCGGLLAADAPAVRENAPEQRDKPYLLLISIDGFRWDFADRYGARHIASIGQRGLRAEALQPVFPTLTFPNHFSIATGRLPADHGLVANEFPSDDRTRWFGYKDRDAVEDGTWYLAEPVWVTAEREGMLTAAFYFVGTEADVGGVHPTHWRAFDAGVDGESRVRQVLDWLARPPEIRPHLITLYFEDVDDDTHRHGVGSPESRAAILQVDEQIGLLLQGIESLPHGSEVFVILLSDHGTAGYRRDRDPLVLEDLVDLTGSRAVEGGPYVYLWFDASHASRARPIRDRINAHWNCGSALLPEDTPAAWAIRPGGRFPDLIVQADPGCAVLTTRGAAHKITPGDHGWAPEMADMRGVFYAMGPRIPAGSRTGVISATAVHGLMMDILELSESASGSPGGALTELLSLSPAHRGLVPGPRFMPQ